MKIKPFGSSSTPLFVYLVVVLGSDGDHVVLEDVGAGVSADGDGVARDGHVAKLAPDVQGLL